MTPLFVIFLVIIALAGLYFFSIALANMLWMRRETKSADLTDGPLISVLVPARNEEIHIGPCIESLMNQTYKNYEVLVIDDNSTDKTGEILASIKERYPDKLFLYTGKPLEEGWNGKPFALNQLCKHAKGEFFLFTDADTVHSSRSVSIAATNMLYHKVDFLSGYIRQRFVSFGEKITVPLMYILSFFILPLWVCKWGKASLLAAAVGQYICVKADTFMNAGGFEQVKKVTTEDVYLARSMKKHGAKTVFVDLKDAAICRMYYSYKECVSGIGKNIFDFMGKNSLILIFAIIGVLLFLALPPFITMVITISTIYSKNIDVFMLAAFWANTIFMYLGWFIVFSSQQLKKSYSLLYPIIFVNLLYVAIDSWRRSFTKKGHEWKGRIVH